MKTAHVSPEMRHVLVSQFRSTTCQCGQPKQARHTFCVACWNRLPEQKRKKLPHLFGEEFAVLYFECVDLLREKASS